MQVGMNVTENVPTFPSARFDRLLYFIQHKYFKKHTFFCFDLSSSGCRHVRFLLKKSIKRLARDIYFCHLALLMTQQTQMARLKMAGLRALFCDFQMLIFNEPDHNFMRTYFCSIPTERTHKASLLRVPFNRRMPAAHRISLVHLLQRGKTLSPPPWDQGEAGKYCPNQDLNPRPLNPESIVTTAYLRHLSPQRLTPDTLCSSTHHPALSHKVLSHQFRCLPITCCPNPTKICLPFNILLQQNRNKFLKSFTTSKI